MCMSYILEFYKFTNKQTRKHTRTRRHTRRHANRQAHISINTTLNNINMPTHSNIQHKHTRAQRKQHKQRKKRTKTHINTCTRKIFTQAHTNTHTRTYTSTANPRARAHGSTRVVPGGARVRAKDTRALLVLHARGSTLRALGRARAREGARRRSLRVAGKRQEPGIGVRNLFRSQ